MKRISMKMTVCFHDTNFPLIVDVVFALIDNILNEYNVKLDFL